MDRRVHEYVVDGDDRSVCLAANKYTHMPLQKCVRAQFGQTKGHGAKTGEGHKLAVQTQMLSASSVADDELEES